jgi:hypothetical protein
MSGVVPAHSHPNRAGCPGKSPGSRKLLKPTTTGRKRCFGLRSTLSRSIRAMAVYSSHEEGGVLTVWLRSMCVCRTGSPGSRPRVSKPRIVWHRRSVDFGISVSSSGRKPQLQRNSRHAARTILRNVAVLRGRVNTLAGLSPAVDSECSIDCSADADRFNLLRPRPNRSIKLRFHRKAIQLKMTDP